MPPARQTDLNPGEHLDIPDFDFDFNFNFNDIHLHLHCIFDFNVDFGSGSGSSFVFHTTPRRAAPILLFFSFSSPTTNNQLDSHISPPITTYWQTRTKPNLIIPYHTIPHLPTHFCLLLLSSPRDPDPPRPRPCPRSSPSLASRCHITSEGHRGELPSAHEPRPQPHVGILGLVSSATIDGGGHEADESSLFSHLGQEASSRVALC